MDIRNVNQEFRIVFQPKNRDLFNGRRRFGVGGKSLHKYVGEHNANKAISKAFKSKTDKYTIKLRKCGTVQFYLK